MVEIKNQGKEKQEEKRHKPRGHKGLYKRGNVWWMRYVGVDGRIIRESSKKSKFKDAEALLIQRRNDVKEGKEPEVKRIANHSFKELAEQYSKWAERQRCFKSKKYLIDYLSEVFGQLPLRRFNTMLLEQHQTERLQKGNKPATVNRLLATIKHMFSKAVEWEMVEEHTLKRIRKVKFLEENNRRLRYLSKEECQELIKACDPHLKPIVVTALNTGMRKSEILGLTWDRVDLKNGFILLDHTKNGERREIPVNGTLRGALSELSQGTKERPRRLDVPYVFYNPSTEKAKNKKVIEINACRNESETQQGSDTDEENKRPEVKAYRDVKRAFASACKRAKITNFHFHDMRHTFASHLVMAGVDLTTVKELLGHKHLTMTLRYAHLAPSHKVKAVDILDSTLNENSTAQLVHKKEVASQ